MHPQLVGKLIEVAIGACQQVLRGDRGALPPPGFRTAALGAAPRAALVRELRQVGSERVDVHVAEPRQRAEVVTAGAAQPLREHPCRDTEVGAVLGEGVLLRLPRVGSQCVDLVAEVHADDVE